MAALRSLGGEQERQIAELKSRIAIRETRLKSKERRLIELSGELRAARRDT